MATTRDLAQLFRAVAENDFSGAAGIAGQICNSEEKAGHHSAARILRGALHSKQLNGIDEKLGRPNDAVFFSTALVRLPADVSLKDVVLNRAARSEIESVIQEWSKREVLHSRGLTPRTKLFFHGPPGCGKSLTSRALACELQLPIFVVRFDAVIGAYLGQTAMHLRQLFSFAETQPCVLLLDELDALGKRRGNPLDVGELDRIVIALLQELEHSRPQGIIIGTSNLAKNLDDALWRRFDLSLEFRAPNSAAMTKYAKEIASKNRIKLPAGVLQEIRRQRSFADAESLVIAEARRQILNDS